MKTSWLLLSLVGFVQCKSARICPDASPSASASVAAPLTTIPIDLPKAMSGAATPFGDVTLVTLVVDKDGAIYFDGAKVTDDQLTQRLKTVRADAGRELFAVLRADTKASHGSVVHAMDLARMNGIARFAIAVEQAR